MACGGEGLEDRCGLFVGMGGHNQNGRSCPDLLRPLLLAPWNCRKFAGCSLVCRPGDPIVSRPRSDGLYGWGKRDDRVHLPNSFLLHA